MAYKLLEAALNHPHSIVPYVTLTRDAAKDIIWAPLREMGAKANIPLQFKANNGDVVLQNGSKIILRGIEDRRQAEKLRGPKYPFVCVDEAQGIPSYLEDVLYEIIEPATMDYPGSQIYLTGTPNASCVGTFYDAVHGNIGNWDVHRWTMQENTPLHASAGMDANAYIAAMLKRRNLTIDAPSVQREWLGKWVRDNESTVYKYKPSLNNITEAEWSALRESVSDWEFVMGLDLGWNDPSAFVVACWSAQAGRFVVVDSHQESEMSSDALARQIGKFFATYGDMPIIADTGGYGKGPSEELKRVYGLPVSAAEKTKKAAFIQFMNSDFRAGSIRILTPKNAELAEQLSLLQVDEKAFDKGVFKEDRRSPNHLCDAALYAWRSSFHQEGEWDHVPMVRGSGEWIAAQGYLKEQEAVKLFKARMDIENNTDSWMDSLVEDLGDLYDFD